MRRSSLLAPLAASLLVLAACGGESEPPPPVPPPTSPEPQTGAPAATPDAGAATQPISPREGAGGTGAPPIGSDATLPPGHPPIGGGGMGTPMGEIPPPPQGSGSGAAALTWKIPQGWVEEPPANPMRKAQYRIPGPGGQGELVVNYFGPGQGGDPMSNAQRWASQFKQPGGGDPMEAMKTSTLDVAGTKVLVVETTGTYAGGASMGMDSVPEKPDYALLGAVVEGPDANWFFKFTGPAPTVQAQRTAFMDMLKSMKRGA